MVWIPIGASLVICLNGRKVKRESCDLVQVPDERCMEGCIPPTPSQESGLPGAWRWDEAIMCDGEGHRTCLKMQNGAPRLQIRQVWM